MVLQGQRQRRLLTPAPYQKLWCQQPLVLHAVVSTREADVQRGACRRGCMAPTWDSPGVALSAT